MVKRAAHLEQPNVGTSNRVAPTIQEIVRKARIKFISPIDLLNILRGEMQGESLNVGFEVIHLSTTDDGEYITCLVHDICQCNAGDECVLTVSDRLQHFTGSDLFLAGLHSASFPRIALFFGLEFSASKRSPWGNSHALSLAHGDDVSLEVTRGRRPTTLVNGELAESIAASILVGLAMGVSASYSLVEGTLYLTSRSKQECR